MTIQNPKTLEWNPAVVQNEVDGAPRSYMVATPSGKELRRNRSQIRQVPQAPPKHVKFDLGRDQVHRFNPGTDQPVNISSGAAQPQAVQTACSPPVGASRAVSATPGADQPVNSAQAAGSHYVTRSGRVVRAPSRMDA